jgi:Domain of unknown function (DUF5624)
MQPYSPHPAFSSLFAAFTGGYPHSIGRQLSQLMQKQSRGDPLLVSSSSDVALFPGSGRAPELQSFRKHTKAFIELTAVSHVPLAICYVARMRELEPESDAWRGQLQLLIDQSRGARQANTIEMWRDGVALETFAGMEAKLAGLVEYTLATSIDYMTKALSAPELLGFDVLRRDYIDAGPDKLPASMNDVMFATFGLALLDIGFRMSTWLRALEIDWSRTMVLVSGQSGRATAGVTWSSNHICNMIWRASRERLPPDRLFVAPHAPQFSLETMPGEEELKMLEQTYRSIWCGTRDSIDVARCMFEGYEPYQFVPSTLDAMPPIRSVDDHAACVGRLRRIMEDPQQLVSNCVTDYICDELYRCNFRPQDVQIPGFSNVDYLRLAT